MAESEPGPQAMHEAFLPHLGWFRHEPGDEVIRLTRRGIFEPPEQAFLWRFLRPGDSVLDAGAHLGVHTVLAYRAALGQARIVAVEPSPRSLPSLRANLERNGAASVTVVDAAVWRDEGEIVLTDEPTGRSAFVRAVERTAEVGEGVAVAAVTLDRLAERFGPFTLAKLDLEGAELEALAGGEAAIRRGALPVLLVECTAANLAARGRSPQELLGRLRGLGYTVLRFDGRDGTPVPLADGDPLWHVNLVAAVDPAAVERRFREAGPEAVAIARDILDRAEACAVHREVEELAALRARIGREAELEAWARRAERALDACRSEGASKDRAARAELDALRAGIERSARDLVIERGLRAKFLERATQLAAALDEMRERWKSASTAVTRLQGESERFRTRIARAEAGAADLATRLDAERDRSRELSSRLAAEGDRAADLESRAEALARELAATRASLASERSLATDRLAWAERAESALASLRSELAATLAWARRSDDALGAEREAASRLRDERDALRGIVTSRARSLARAIGLGRVPPSGPGVP
jgi:FkbM family methyltransferase